MLRLVFLAVALVSIGHANVSANELMSFPFLDRSGESPFGEVAKVASQPLLGAKLAANSLMNIVSPMYKNDTDDRDNSASSIASSIASLASNTKHVIESPLDYAPSGVTNMVKDVVKNSLNLVPMGSSVALGQTAFSLFMDRSQSRNQLFTLLSLALLLVLSLLLVSSTSFASSSSSSETSPETSESSLYLWWWN